MSNNRDNKELALIAIFALLWFSGGMWYLMQPFEKTHVIVYDCSLAEISPDFPVQAKEECRKHRSGRL